MMRFDLHSIARRNLIDELNEILRLEIDVDAVDDFGATALHYGIAHKNVAVALALIEHGADVTIRNREGKTALHSAIEHGLYDVAVAVVRKDPAVVAIADNHGNEPLWTAAFNARGKYHFVELLLASGADVSHENKVGLCPLDIPNRMGDPELLEIMEKFRHK